MKWRILELKVAISNFYSVNFVFFFHLFIIHDLNRHFLSISYVPSIILGATERAMNKGKKGPALTELLLAANSTPQFIIM